jgi:hypothetical protein
VRDIEIVEYDRVKFLVFAKYDADLEIYKIH